MQKNQKTCKKHNQVEIQEPVGKNFDKPNNL